MWRVAFYAHDTYGLGHLRRCLKLAASISKRLGSVQGLLITGSPWAHLFSPPAGFAYVRLPAVSKVDAERYRPRQSGTSFDRLLAERRRRVTRAVEGFGPDLMIVDNVPAGLSGEVLPALQWLRDRGRGRQVLVLRDILDREETIHSQWAEANAAEVLTTLYDEIWVFGRAEIFDPRVAYPIPDSVAPRVVFCGYLGGTPLRTPSEHAGIHPRMSNGTGDHNGDADAAELTAGEQGKQRTRWLDSGRGRRKRPVVLLTGGGGGDAAQLVSTYLEALRRNLPPVDSRIVLGPDFPSDARADCFDRNGFEADVTAFEPDLPRAMATSDVIVSMAGYNTVCEILAAARPVVLVPRVRPRQEQLMRATALQRAGRAKVLHPDSLDPATLWRAVEELLDAPAPLREALAGGEAAAGRAAALLSLENDPRANKRHAHIRSG